jgi:hypothetical protein
MRKPQRKVYLSTSIPSLVPIHGEVASLTEALFKLDPREWRREEDGESHHDEWLAVAMGCKFDGISEDDWVAWCIGDEWYANDADVIRRKWRSLQPTHGGAFRKALAAHGIKVGKARQARELSTFESAEVHLLPPATASSPATPTKSEPPANFRSRSRGLINWLRPRQSEPNLFKVAAIFADELALSEGTTQRFLAGEFPQLRKALGEKCFRRTISNAYAHINAKTERTATDDD